MILTGLDISPFLWYNRIKVGEVFAGQNDSDERRSQHERYNEEN